MEKGYHKGQELSMSELGLSLEELAGQPLELFAREGAKLLLTVALEEEVTDAPVTQVYRGCVSHNVVAMVILTSCSPSVSSSPSHPSQGHPLF